MVLLLQLPLPPSFFQCPPMTSDMAESVKATAVHTTYDLVSKIQLRGGPNQYECVSDEHDLKIYKGLKDTIGPHGEAVPVYCAHMEVVATIDEVIALFHTEVTNPKAFCRRFGKGLLDAVTLYELESSLGPQNRITVTWRAYDSQLPSVVRRRDVCAVECHDEFTLGGRRGWVRAFKSIELPCCPGLETHMGLVRMANYGSGHVFVESELRPGYLDMYFVTQVDYCEGKSEWLLTDVLRCKKLLAKVITKKRCRSLLDIDRFLREDRLRQLPAVPMDPTYRHHCFMCTKRLMPIVKRTACHTCGHVFCPRCIQSWRVRANTTIMACYKCSIVQPTGFRSKYQKHSAPPPSDIISLSSPFKSQASHNRSMVSSNCTWLSDSEIAAQSKAAQTQQTPSGRSNGY